MHYTRWQRHGDPLTCKVSTDPTGRFLEKVDKQEGGCWLWTAHGDVSGYGRFKMNGRDRLAHGVAYELFVGPIPEGLQLDHKCHNASDCTAGARCEHRRCVNPDHLEPVTARENTRRGKTIAARYAARTHCGFGHPLSGENVRMQGGGARICRSCNRRRQQESIKARKVSS